MNSEKIKVAILGATGSVGQKFIQLLEDHPWFEVAAVAASDRSAGKKYGEAANWIMTTPLPQKIANMTVQNCEPVAGINVAFSGLDSSVAGEIETNFAKAGYKVISNARNHRQDADVPLLIPEVNPEHLDLVKTQNYGDGCIVTNPNCSTIGMVLALKPLHDAFGLEQVNVVTLQAISGAGFPGLSSFTITENVIPHIGGEEDKLENEPLKLFGKLTSSGIEPAELPVSAQVNRVPVIDGHTESVQVVLKNEASAEQIMACWREFSAEPQKLKLPSAPQPVIHYFERPDYPQPRLHRDLGGGMAIGIGNLRPCPLFDYKFTVLSHNTVRGAAGGTILCAELMQARGLLG